MDFLQPIGPQLTYSPIVMEEMQAAEQSQSAVLGMPPGMPPGMPQTPDMITSEGMYGAGMYGPESMGMENPSMEMLETEGLGSMGSSAMMGEMSGLMGGGSGLMGEMSGLMGGGSGLMSEMSGQMGGGGQENSISMLTSYLLQQKEQKAQQTQELELFAMLEGQSSSAGGSSSPSYTPYAHTLKGSLDGFGNDITTNAPGADGGNAINLADYASSGGFASLLADSVSGDSTLNGFEMGATVGQFGSGPGAESITKQGQFSWDNGKDIVKMTGSTAMISSNSGSTFTQLAGGKTALNGLELDLNGNNLTLKSKDGKVKESIQNQGNHVSIGNFSANVRDSGNLSGAFAGSSSGLGQPDSASGTSSGGGNDDAWGMSAADAAKVKAEQKAKEISLLTSGGAGGLAELLGSNSGLAGLLGGSGGGLISLLSGGAGGGLAGLLGGSAGSSSEIETIENLLGGGGL